MNENNILGASPQPSPFPGDIKQPAYPPQAQPEPQVPPPPSTESQVGVRTMSGDSSSLSSSGGETQQPKTFRPKDLIGGEPVFQPKTAAPTVATPAEAKAKHVRVLIMAVLGAIVAIGLAVAGFIFVPKLLQKPVPPPPPVVAAPTASISANPNTIEKGMFTVLSWQTTDATSANIDGIGAVEPNGSKEVSPTETTVYHLIATGPGGTKEATINVAVTVPPAFQHQSMFPEASKVASISVVAAVLSPAGFNSALKTATSTDTVSPEFKEVVPLDSANMGMNAYAFLPLFMPSLTKEYLVATIAEDFTAFVYKDKDGVWPGYAVKINNNISGAPATPTPADTTTLISSIEQLPTVFYVDDPGAPKAAKFNNGSNFSASIQSIQYLAYAKTGASFNVATVKSGSDTFVIWSTSFNGIKEAIKQFGF